MSLCMRDVYSMEHIIITFVQDCLYNTELSRIKVPHLISVLAVSCYFYTIFPNLIRVKFTENDILVGTIFLYYTTMCTPQAIILEFIEYLGFDILTNLQY